MTIGMSRVGQATVKGVSVVKIEAVSKSSDVSLSGKREVWVHVFSNEVHDWPGVEAKLSGPQRTMLSGLGARRAVSYFPHSPTGEERDEHGYLCDDWWVWRAGK